MTCAQCGQGDHESKTCHNAISCANCKGSHFAYSRECPKWKQETQVQQVRVEKHVSFPEARILVETMSGAVAGNSYATAVKVSTTNASVQTDLTWPNGADRFMELICCDTGLFGFSESTGGLHIWTATPEQACVK